MWKYFAALTLLSLAAEPSEACRVSRYPIDPAVTKSDVIIIGRVFDIRLEDPIQGKWFSVRLEAVVSGRFPAPTYSTGWTTGIGTCGPRGPDVDEGDQVAVYFRYVDGKPIEQGWTKIASANKTGEARKASPALGENVR